MACPLPSLGVTVSNDRGLLHRIELAGYFRPALRSRLQTDAPSPYPNAKAVWVGTPGISIPIDHDGSPLTILGLSTVADHVVSYALPGFLQRRNRIGVIDPETYTLSRHA